jgi:hypothetical protein
MAGANLLRELIRRRVRELRADRSWRLEDVASRAEEQGLSWNWDTVAAIERGTRALSNEELLLLPRIFDVQFEVLFKGEDRIALSGAVNISAETMRRTLVGKAEDPQTHTIYMASIGPPEDQFGLPTITQPWSLTEQRAAARLGVSPEELTKAAIRLWEHPLSRERDRRVQERAKEGSSPQTLRALRGHITRELTNELRKSIDEKKAQRRKKGGKK